MLLGAAIPGWKLMVEFRKRWNWGFLGRFRGGNSSWGAAVVLGFGVRLGVMEWELWCSGGVFCWISGRKPHGKVAGKGKVLMLSRVNKGREE